MTFAVATYNVLATAYIRPAWYPFTPTDVLDPRHRIPALVQHLASLRADVLCLQEVEDETFAALDRHLSSLGYHGELVKKGGGKPDGCAAFVQTQVFHLLRSSRLDYHETAGEPPSGHVAQLLVLGTERSRLVIANTHLKWDPPATPLDRQYGYRQIRQLLAARTAEDLEASAWIICGDLNATPDSAVLQTLSAAGFRFTHAAMIDAATCNSNHRAKMIDFLLHDGALGADPIPLIPLLDTTPMPGPAQPSDHLAVMARFDWA